MKRFFCAAFFVVVVALLAACGALNTSSAAATGHGHPHQLHLPHPEVRLHCKVNETAAQGRGRNCAEQRDAQRHRVSRPCRDPGHGRFPRYVSGRCRRADSDLLCRSFDAA